MDNANAAQHRLDQVHASAQMEIDRLKATGASDTSQLVNKIQQLEQAISTMQAGIASGGSGSWYGGSGSGGYSKDSTRGAMEHKAIMNLQSQGNDRGTYRMWHEKLVNAFEQLNGQYRGLLEGITKKLTRVRI